MEVTLSPDKSRVRFRDESSSNLTPEIRAAIAEHEAALLKCLLFREAATFVSRRLEEAEISWTDPAYDAALLAFGGGDDHERLNEAWMGADPEPVKEILRLCARSGVRAISSAQPAGRNGDQPPQAAASSGPRRATPSPPAGTIPEAQKTDDRNPQLPLYPA